MIDARFVPCEQWPKEKTPRHSRRTLSGKAIPYARLLDDLEYELRKLGARDIIIQAYFKRDDIRNDGWPRSSAKPSESGVIVSFINRDRQEISFPCDTYQAYEDNLRAVSLTLTALRAIDRYGVSQQGEQYNGWAKLPEAPTRMSHKSAMEFLALYSGIAVTSKESLTKAYREAAQHLHPDNQRTGNHDQFVLLSQTKQVIEEVHGWA